MVKKRKGPTPKKKRIQLIVIPEPEPNTRAVLGLTPEAEGTLIMKGDARGIIMECGNCGAPLTEGILVNQLHGLVLRCQNCGAFNETLA